MAGPVVADFQVSNFTDSSPAETIASITWTAGAVVVVVAISASDDGATAMDTPTCTGLTFASIATTNTASNCRVSAWSATAAGSGSGTVTTFAYNAVGAGACAFVFTGSSGIGASALMASTATTNATQSLTRGFNNSAVICAMGDWSAIADVAVTTTPATAGTVRVIQRLAGEYTAYVGSWTDQGTAGATAYGIANYTATAKWIGLVLEVKASGVTDVPRAPAQGAPAFTGRTPNLAHGIPLPGVKVTS